MDDVRASKLLSLVLRHRPEAVGITLDAGGWVGVEPLLEALRAAALTGRLPCPSPRAHAAPATTSAQAVVRLPRELTRADLERIVAGSDKQRFALDRTGDRIRANQGHSVPVDLGPAPADPPALLYHGTAAANLPSIRMAGLRRGSRHDVHLSADAATARRVAARRSRPVVLVVEAARMVADGHVFRVSANGVWLTPGVPPAYLKPLTGDRSAHD